MDLDITLPDGSVRSFENSITGDELAKNIGSRLHKDAVCIEIENKFYDLSYSITENCNVRIVTINDLDALHILRHSSAHILAQAVLNIFPNTEYGVGPSIENGFYYDFKFTKPISESDLEQIESEMKKIVQSKQEFTRDEISKKDALKLFKKQSFKVELIKSAESSEGVSNDYVSTYRNEQFVDLCMGPHIPNTSFLKYFKLTKVAGAYWRGDENNPQLQRIYGTSWFSKEDLDLYMAQQEEAEKRDHRKLGNELNLFTSTDELGSGNFIWKPNGAILRDVIETFSKNAHLSNDYQLVNTPHIGKSVLWETSGHLAHYKENMYPPVVHEENNETYYLKPMNCPFHILVYKSDDAHIFCTKDQINKEVKTLLNFSVKLLNAFGLNEIEADLSTKPDKSIGSDDDWDMATESLKKSLTELGIPFATAEGEGAFYGPKIDLHVKDAIGRRWQLSTIQVDFAQPDNFDIEYVDNNNKKIRPVMIHRALLGSIERFTGVLLEHYAGHMPGWLSPVQIDILTIGNVSSYVDEIKEHLNDFRINIDDRNVRLGEKIHNSQKIKVPIQLIVGEKDVSNKTFAINFYNAEDKKDIELEKGIKEINNYLKTPEFDLNG